MPDVIINGPDGRLEGRYQHSRVPNAPIAIVLHPHPQYGGTMNNKVVYALYNGFARHGFSVLRFNFRGVGRSQGGYDRGEGELSDAASALDWLQSFNQSASACWIAGFSFGAWIGMQLLMRRPEISGFVSVAPPGGLGTSSRIGLLGYCALAASAARASSSAAASPARPSARFALMVWPFLLDIRPKQLRSFCPESGPDARCFSRRAGYDTIIPTTRIAAIRQAER